MRYSLETLDNGIKFVIRPDLADDCTIKEIWENGDYEQVGFMIKEGFTIIDIGAHIGIFTAYAAKKTQTGMVYAYEPHPGNFKLLRANILVNKIKNAKIFNCGIGETEGVAKLFLWEPPTCYSMYNIYGQDNNFIMIKTVSLVQIFKENCIRFCDFLKIDTEGAELEILRNVSKEYLNKIGIVVLEYHNIFDKQQLIKLVMFLSKQGFKIKIRLVHGTKDVGMLYAKNTFFINFRISMLCRNIFEYYKSRVIFNSYLIPRIIEDALVRIRAKFI